MIIVKEAENQYGSVPVNKLKHPAWQLANAIIKEITGGGVPITLTNASDIAGPMYNRGRVPGDTLNVYRSDSKSIHMTLADSDKQIIFDDFEKYRVGDSDKMEEIQTYNLTPDEKEGSCLECIIQYKLIYLMSTDTIFNWLMEDDPIIPKDF